MNALQTAKELWAQPQDLIQMWEDDPHKIRHERLVVLQAGKKQGYLVDLGCGAGRFAHRFEFEQYQGYDQSTPMIEFAREWAASRSAERFKKAEFSVIDIFQFISDHSYDTLIMVDVAQHQQEPLEAIHLILKQWKAKRYFFTLLLGDKKEELLNSIVVARADFQDFVKANNLEVCYTEKNHFDWVIVKYEAHN